MQQSLEQSEDDEIKIAMEMSMGEVGNGFSPGVNEALS
jgi:hypothetical protein